MYRKFNNIYRKLYPEDLVGNVDKNSSTYKKAVKSVNKNNFEMGVESPTFLEFENIKYTFGVELETIGGSIPPEDSMNLNIKTDFDGSLRGPNGEEPTGAEYVTGVLKGDTGLKQLYNICKVLSKRCKLDYRCGVHIHIGNLNWGKEEALYAYILGMLIEYEVFNMLPKSRRKNSYCRPLTKIFDPLVVLDKLSEAKKTSASNYIYIVDRYFSNIFYEVSGGIPESSDCNKNTNHPKGSKCGYNKSSQRYCWMNFVTLLFNTKVSKNSHTLEIRNHGASLNYSKIKNWLKIWMAFCYYIDNSRYNMLELKDNIKLEHIILSAYPKTGKKLLEYVHSRTDLFRESNEEVDYVAETHDKTNYKEILAI